MRQRFGQGGAGKATPVFITESEKEWYPQELLSMAQEVSPALATTGIKQWRRAVREGIRHLREAQAETAFAFLLRKGIQNIANDWYQTVPREWQDYCSTNPSTTFAEWYGPLYGSIIAGEVDEQQRFPEGRLVGENAVLVNHKFGLVESFARELFDDDQTNQIKNRASRLGQSMAQTENAYMAIRFIGTAGSYANVSVKVSNYKTTDVN